MQRLPMYVHLLSDRLFTLLNRHRICTPLIVRLLHPAIAVTLVCYRFIPTTHPCICYSTAEFATYLNYCRSLRFEDKPDYAYLRRLFRDLFYREGFHPDFVYDWTILNYTSYFVRRLIDLVAPGAC